MELLLAEENVAFLIAACVFLGLILLELLAFVGLPAPSAWADNLLPEPGDAGAWLDWLGIGQVPLAVLLIILLGSYAGFGLVGQSLLRSLAGAYLPAWLAAPAALLPTFLLGPRLARRLARVLPRDESYAVHSAALVGARAMVTGGRARKGFAAEARLSDHYGQTHYVMVEPEREGEELAAGTPVILVRRIGEARYTATVDHIAHFS